MVGPAIKIQISPERAINCAPKKCEESTFCLQLCQIQLKGENFRLQGTSGPICQFSALNEHDIQIPHRNMVALVPQMEKSVLVTKLDILKIIDK